MQKQTSVDDSIGGLSTIAHTCNLGLHMHASRPERLIRSLHVGCHVGFPAHSLWPSRNEPDTFVFVLSSGDRHVVENVLNIPFHTKFSSRDVRLFLALLECVAADKFALWDYNPSVRQ